MRDDQLGMRSDLCRGRVPAPVAVVSPACGSHQHLIWLPGALLWRNHDGLHRAYVWALELEPVDAAFLEAPDSCVSVSDGSGLTRCICRMVCSLGVRLSSHAHLLLMDLQSWLALRSLAHTMICRRMHGCHSLPPAHTLISFAAASNFLQTPQLGR